NIVLIIIITLFFSRVSLSQQNKADSLIHLLKSVNGEKKVEILNDLADIYQFIDTHEALKYAEKGIILADSIGYKKGLAGCYGSLGYGYINLDNIKAEAYTNKALEIRKAIQDKAGIATSLNVLGVLNYYQGEYLKSIEYHLEALKLREQIGDPVKIATSYNNIAIVNIALENFESALDYLHRALKIRTETDNHRAIAIIKVNIGKIKSLQGNNQEALSSFYEALKINKEFGIHKSTADTYQNIASISKVLDNTQGALNYYDSALVIYNTLDEKNGIANVQNGLAQVYTSIGKYDLAIEHSLVALNNSDIINSLENKSIALETLHTCYKNKNDYQKAYQFLSLHENAIEELTNSDKVKKLAKIELDYRLEKMKLAQEEKLKNQRLFIFLLVLIVLFGIIIVGLLIRNTKNKKKVNEELKLLNLKLNEVNRTKDKFLSIIAHDLRGPYQTTLGLSQLISDDFEEYNRHELKESIKNLNSSFKNQYNLLNDLLHWAELQDGNFNLQLKSLKIFDAVNDVNSLLALTAKKKNIQLFNSVDPNSLVLADKNMLHLVLRNLISNSVKFTPKNGYVKVTTEINETDVVLCVEDSGVGISKEIQNNLFKLDSHNSQKGTANEEGSGLGLILCKEIIEKHNGSIWVESEINEGSKFFFTLPNKQIN
ncbi:MAG: tetratricopeptide repeat-containing sensor histidine kinase, partial [Melioribacteraceae bacterium]|nr:tetratricopeptide repeat-containing sensor histidine kinase [Melioribacteraceae bacterium]